jgi:peptide/nickel transport system substrate-binding protein
MNNDRNGKKKSFIKKLEVVKMKDKQKTRQIWISFILILVFVLSACSQATPTPTEETKPDQPTAVPTEETQPGETEISENVGTQAITISMSTLDPHWALGGDGIPVMNVYETLVKWDKDGGGYLPALAESWESNDSGDEWIFHLREGVTFHDGTPFTAEAVKFSYQRVIDIAVLGYYLEKMEEMEVIDDFTIRFVLSEPRNLPSIFAAMFGMYSVNPNIADKPEGWFDEGNDAGTGPYTLESNDPGSRVVVTRYKDYWRGWEEGQFTKVVFEFVPDETLREQMIRSGEADIVESISYDLHESLEATGEINVITTTDLYPNMLYLFKHDNPPLDDIRVRQALAYSFPYEDVQSFAFNGLAEISAGLAPNALLPHGDLPTYHYDLEKAQALLDEAGLANGTEIRLATRAGRDTLTDVALLWQVELAKLGIDLVIEETTAEWDIMFDTESDLHILMKTWGPGYLTAYEYLFFYDSRNTFTPFNGFHSQVLNDLCDQALAAEATNQEEANRLYLEVEKILYEEAAGVWALDWPIDVEVRSDLVGFISHSWAWNGDWYEYSRE